MEICILDKPQRPFRWREPELARPPADALAEILEAGQDGDSAIRPYAGAAIGVGSGAVSDRLSLPSVVSATWVSSGECHVVYHADDSFSKMPQWTNEHQIAEEDLVSQASLLIASSPGIARTLPGGRTASVRVLQNGAPVDVFAERAKNGPRPDLQSIPRPRIH